MKFVAVILFFASCPPPPFCTLITHDALPINTARISLPHLFLPRTAIKKAARLRSTRRGLWGARFLGGRFADDAHKALGARARAHPHTPHLGGRERCPLSLSLLFPSSPLHLGFCTIPVFPSCTACCCVHAHTHALSEEEGRLRRRRAREKGRKGAAAAAAAPSHLCGGAAPLYSLPMCVCVCCIPFLCRRCARLLASCAAARTPCGTLLFFPCTFSPPSPAAAARTPRL